MPLPTEASDDRGLRRLLARRAAYALAVGFMAIPFALHVTWGLGCWIGLPFLVVAVALAFLLPWEPGTVRRWGVAIGVLVLSGTLYFGATSIIDRYRQQAPARAVATQLAAQEAQQVAAKQSQQAQEQRILDAAGKTAADQLLAQGFSRDTAGTAPTVYLATLASGTMTIYIQTDAGGHNSTLPIKKVGGFWIAGCPTIDPHRIYWFDDPGGNAIAMSLHTAGSCPAGILPPSGQPGP